MKKKKKENWFQLTADKEALDDHKMVTRNI